MPVEEDELRAALGDVETFGCTQNVAHDDVMIALDQPVARVFDESAAERWVRIEDACKLSPRCTRPQAAQCFEDIAQEDDHVGDSLELVEPRKKEMLSLPVASEAVERVLCAEMEITQHRDVHRSSTILAQPVACIEKTRAPSVFADKTATMNRVQQVLSLCVIAALPRVAFAQDSTSTDDTGDVLLGGDEDRGAGGSSGSGAAGDDSATLDEVDIDPLGSGTDPDDTSSIDAAPRTFPKVYTQRSLVLPRGKLRLDVAPTSLSIDNSGAVGGPNRGLMIGRHGASGVGGGVTVSSLSLGATMGIVDNVEVGTVLLPIVLAPDFDFGDMEFFGKYRFLWADDLEVAGLATLRLPTNSNLAIAVGVPVIYHMGPYMKVEGGAELELIFDNTVLNVDLPIGLAYNIQPELFIAGRSGLFIPDFESVVFPLGVQVGYTLLRPGVPQMDIIGALDWPYFLNTDSGFLLSTWRLTVGANILFDLPLD